jgi:5-methylcytosine-specific restriction enzyme subunit McrC
MTADTEVLALTEHEPYLRPARALPAEVGAALYRQYHKQVSVEFPSLVTDQQWRITPGGWVGYLPILPGWGAALQPKVPLASLFGMLDYAYQLDLQFLKGAYASQSLDEFFEVLAGVLARRVLERGRRGFYRAYIPRAERLAYVRGRLDVPAMARQPAEVRPWCAYEEHTADTPHNQALAWTLQLIARNVLCGDRVRPLVRRAFHGLHGLVSSVPFAPSDVANLAYNRLNDDYAPLHRLCRFFLEHSGPHHALGGTPMLPFAIDMDRLFELFVAGWLRQHLPLGHALKAQERMEFGSDDELVFQIDLLLSRPGASRPWCVLDTKYKRPTSVSPADVQQVVAYAVAAGCSEAFLVYPVPLARPFDATIGHIRVRSLIFDVSQALELAGQTILRALVNPHYQ